MNCQPDGVFLACVSEYLKLDVDDDDPSPNRVLFTVSDGVLRVPGRAPFGGIFSTQEHRNVIDSLDRFISFTSADFKVRELKFVFPQLGFNDDLFVPQAKHLISKWFGVSNTDVSQGIATSAWGEKSLSKGNRKKVRQFSESGGLFRPAERRELQAIYGLIQENRYRKGVSPSIAFDQLERAFIRMSNVYSAWVTEIQGKIASAAVTVRVSPWYEYVYMWADSLEFRNFSPVSTLCAGIVAHCKSLNVLYLDLGISSIEGVIDEGLFRFKSNLGALPHEKISVSIEV